MVKIGVISDTHLTQPTEELESLMNGLFKDVEMILHAGDITEMAVLEAFAEKKVLAVCGNMDSPALRRELPARRVFQAGKFRFGLIHGWGAPRGIEERIVREFERVDCVVFGHTHTPCQKKRQGVFLFNPGAFGGGFGSSPKSVGILTLNETLSAQIVYL